MPEIAAFARHNHMNVMHPSLRYVNCLPKIPLIDESHTKRLLALALELPEDALVKKHEYDAVGESFGKNPHSLKLGICSPVKR
jgi:hypothetical protein